jgi:hypothetical protein
MKHLLAFHASIVKRKEKNSGKQESRIVHEVVLALSLRSSFNKDTRGAGI